MRLQPNRRRGVLLEQARDTHIAAEHLDAAVPCLPHDGVLRVHPGRDGDGAASSLWPWPFDASEISELSEIEVRASAGPHETEEHEAPISALVLPVCFHCGPNGSALPNGRRDKP